MVVQACALYYVREDMEVYILEAKMIHFLWFAPKTN